MRRLQKVHAVEFDLRSDAVDIFRVFQRLPKDRGADRAASAMRHGTNKGCDRNQRRSLALTPANESSGSDPHQQRILAAVSFGRHFRHGEIKEIDRFNLSHKELPLERPRLAMNCDFLYTCLGRCE